MTVLSRALLGLVAAAFLLPAQAASDVVATAVPAAAVTTADGRWAPSFAAFALADKTRMPDAGGVVFVGSSSIRLWDNLEQQFGDDTVIVKRGFGGSRMEDCTANLERLVLSYKPRMVVVYAGENDLAEGRQPAQVLTSFTRFVEGVRAALPNARIAYVSIKPSVARAKMLSQVRATNALIKDYVAGLANAQFIDVFTPMLDAAGAPRADLFSDDKLHMNAAGYAIWQTAIAPALK